MEINKSVKKDNKPPDIEECLKKINEQIVIPDILKLRTRNGGYIAWPDNKERYGFSA